MIIESNRLAGGARVIRLVILAAALCCAGLAIGTARAQTAPGLAPADIAQLLDAEPLPPLILDPARRHGLLVLERRLLPIERLAEPTIDLAGRRLNPVTASAHAPLDYYGLSLVSLATGEQTRLSLPRGAVVGYPVWSPDGARFAFTVGHARGTDIWIGEVDGARTYKLADEVYAARGAPCSWAGDSRRLLCRFVPRLGGVSPEALRDFFDGAQQQGALGEPVMVSDSLARALLESQLTLIDVISRQQRPIGRPAAFEAVSMAPAGAFVLVERIKRPYPRISGIDDVERVREVWDRFGRVVRQLPDGIRAPAWHGGEPATLVWVAQRSGIDRVVALRAPYAELGEVKFELPHRFSGLRWVGDTSAALVSDFDAERNRTEHWLVDFGTSTAQSLLSHRSNAARWPIMTTNRHGIEAIAVNDGSIYMRGEQSGPEGRRAVLERVALDSGEETRVWEASQIGHETLVDIVTPDAGAVLIRYETASVPPNYFLSDARGQDVRALTHYVHPAPPLTGMRHIRLEYTRDDGLDLAASLYLPPDYEPGTRLPLIVWAYPRQVGVGAVTRRTAEQARFPTFERAFRLFFLLHGFAVLDGVSMPIVGASASANDTFIEQIVANADAALAAAEATGFVDRQRVGVAGHSYGAFMVANLLAHSELFRAGAALSGAYNRTLTPFGFQTERRTLWEAPDTYLAMSPLLFSHQIAAPLLLVHGLKDDNAGTSPLQSTQFYQAIRGNGGDTELLLLPWEGHSYRARESVFKTATHLLSWFEQHLETPQTFGAEKETGALLRPSQ
jgi:dipeptidyl aminopeptidase/acylaminoacyl peptidase